MKIVSIEFVDNWSWGLVFKSFGKIESERVFYEQGGNVQEADGDVNLVQNITLLKLIRNKFKSVCRLGGPRNFEEPPENVDLMRQGMAKCFALVATNRKLYNIAKEVNSNAHLIPNGLDLEVWKPRKFRVGFSGNISTDIYREYKGYDLVREACDSLGYEMIEALYKSSQIPHDEMRERFYDRIDCLVHPSRGEGCSNTVMEALACGVPVICTRECGYHGEMLEHGTNVLFCERTVESIIDNIKLLAADPSKREILSVNGRRFAETHHNVKEIAAKYMAIIEDCYERTRDSVGNDAISKGCQQSRA